MRKLTMALTVVALAMGAMTLQASAQNQWRGAPALKNATPVPTRVDCRGGTGACGCGPGWITACPDRCCRCVPCN
jgi:hypothetical protein